ncbi:condensation domain-containing protein [Streptomyces viridochromogenes]|uniref:condensation domain-containing protein n=1 Tax=Streptomyces viridochromogenes TaxID=1938 RepID=UPI00069E6BCE|nr:condensation domain-containing protein [Streptomyces viridochromogenes]KOG18036.1 hypothetical protein ADK36_23785 [Streptomyces viridochromogenes]KOG18693.1 hypothetical protein ADK35_21460 [Streptomyces viridochromogenes]
MPADPLHTAVPHDLPTPVVPQFFHDVCEITGPDTLRMPLAACLAAVLSGYTGRAELAVDAQHFSVKPATTLLELAVTASPGGRGVDGGVPQDSAAVEAHRGAGLLLRWAPGSLSADYDTDRYSRGRVDQVLSDVRRVLTADLGTTVAELNIAPLSVAADPSDEALVKKGPVPLEGPVEQAVAEVWSQFIEVIGPSEIGRDDNYFALGGDSLSAIRATNRLSEHFGLDLPKQLLSTSPTPREVAAVIRAVGTTARQGDTEGPVAHSEDTPLPVSAAQEAVWLFEQWQPGTTAYHVPWAIELTGALARERLRGSLEAVVGRHSVLRTAFHDRDGCVEAVPVRQAEVPWTEHDLTPAATGPGDPEAVMAQLIAEPFDLSRAPLLRADLLRLSAQHHILLLTFHHLLLDSGSLEILLRELAAGYDARELPELRLQYRDVADWQQQAASRQHVADATAYWRRELADAPAPLELPGCRHRTGPPDHAGDSVTWALDDELTHSVRTLAQRLGVTSYTVLFTAFQSLLYRITGQDDLVLGTAVSTRDRTECEGLIGPFFATMPVRTRVHGDQSFVDLVRQTQQRTTAAFAWKDVPFHTLHTGQGAAYQILFEVSRPAVVPPPTGLSWNYRLLNPAATKLDLIFTLSDHGTSLGGAVTYATDRYDRSTAERLTREYPRLLAAACATPRQPLNAWEYDAPGDLAHEDGTGGDGDPSRTVLTRLWAEVLDIPADDIGPHSDFFGLGGRSLDAVRLNSRLRKTLQVTVAPAQLFRAADFNAQLDVIRRHATAPDALHRRASLVLTAWDLRPEERHTLTERRPHV